MIKDRSVAKALEIAERMLIKEGWKWSADDLGKRAGRILLSVEAELIPPKPGQKS